MKHISCRPRAGLTQILDLVTAPVGTRWDQMVSLGSYNLYVFKEPVVRIRPKGVFASLSHNYNIEVLAMDLLYLSPSCVCHNRPLSSQCKYLNTIYEHPK